MSVRGVGLKSDTGYTRAFDEARRLGHHWVGEEHLLLALSRQDGRTGEALRAAGATPERLEQSIVAGVERSDPPAECGVAGSPSPTPAMYSTLGRADGLALARGEASASGDLLAALLWHAGLGSWLLLLVSDFSRTPPQAVPEEQMSDRGPTPGA